MPTTTSHFTQHEIHKFRAALAGIERQAVETATTSEEAAEFAGAIRQCWTDWGFLGAWRADMEASWQRVNALAISLPALPMENPWKAKRDRLRRELAAFEA